VLLSLDPKRPESSLVLTVRPGKELAPGEKLTAERRDRLAAVVQVLNRDFEPAVSIRLTDEPDEAT
jgi:hypothetical protein